MPVQFAVVCESNADFRTITGMVERVVSESATIDWVRDYLDACPIWAKLDDRTPCLLWQDADDYVKHYKLKLRYGHFDGSPGEIDARAARRALLVLKHMFRDRIIDGVLLIRDDDGEISHRQGLEQARQDDRSAWRDRIVIGVASRMRECWVLHGFEPENHEEESRLGSLRDELGFDPRTSSQRLGDKGDGEPRSPKRVLRTLTNQVYERERRCWEATPLKTLRDRGEETGLAAFLAEVDDRLVSAIQPVPPRS